MAAVTRPIKVIMTMFLGRMRNARKMETMRPETKPPL
jgi:hypothetical protein